MEGDLSMALLPHSVRGIFLMYNNLDYPVFLTRPSTEPDIFGNLDLHRDPDPYQCSFTKVVDHCNGLLLYNDLRGIHVANPATRRRARLPPPPRFRVHSSSIAHLLFDATESPHYEVLLVLDSPRTEEMDSELRQQQATNDDKPSMEWPATTWVLCVFLSRTGQWEERAFVREDETTGVVSDKVSQYCDPLSKACGAYWRGAYYVQCNGGSTVMRISLSNDKYRVIKCQQKLDC